MVYAILPEVTTLKRCRKRIGEELVSLRRSRNEAMRSGGHAATLLDCANRRIHLATAAAKNVNRRPVALCVDKFLKLGLEEVEIVNTEMLEGTLNEPAKVTIS